MKMNQKDIKKTKDKILEKLEDKKTISINPPPQDGNCEGCGKNVKDLKPFGKAGDPLVGNFDGAKLVKTYRGGCIPVTNKKYLEIEKQSWKTFESFEEAVFKEFGKKKGEQLMWQDQSANSVGASWECRDCICLDEVAYFKMKFDKK